MAKVVTEKLTLKFKRRKMKDREIERRESWGCMDVIVVGRKRGLEGGNCYTALDLAGR